MRIDANHLPGDTCCDLMALDEHGKEIKNVVWADPEAGEYLQLVLHGDNDEYNDEYDGWPARLVRAPVRVVHESTGEDYKP